MKMTDTMISVDIETDGPIIKRIPNATPHVALADAKEPGTQYLKLLEHLNGPNS